MEFERAKITGRNLKVLLLLSSKSKGMTPTEIAKELGLANSSYVTHAIKTLLKGKLISRKELKDTKRRVVYLCKTK